MMAPLQGPVASWRAEGGKGVLPHRPPPPPARGPRGGWGRGRPGPVGARLRGPGGGGGGGGGQGGPSSPGAALPRQPDEVLDRRRVVDGTDVGGAGRVDPLEQPLERAPHAPGGG